MLLRQLQAGGIVEDPAPGFVALAGRLLAPVAECLQGSELTAIELPGVLDALQQIRVAAPIGGERIAPVGQHPGLLALRQALLMQVLPYWQQPGDILGGILALRLAERPLQPVGAGLPLGQFHVTQLLDQGAIAEAEADIQQRGGPLGVEQRFR